MGVKDLSIRYLDAYNSPPSPSVQPLRNTISGWAVLLYMCSAAKSKEAREQHCREMVAVMGTVIYTQVVEEGTLAGGSLTTSLVRQQENYDCHNLKNWLTIENGQLSGGYTNS